MESAINNTELKEIYQMLCETRFFQELLVKKELVGYYGLGEEAMMIGCLAALKKDDIINAYFRGCDRAIDRYKKGVSIKTQMAWFMKKKNPGSNYDPQKQNSKNGILYLTSSCIGCDMDLSCGAAISQKLLNTGRVVLLLSGDGATSKGNFHETLNFAALQKAPLIYFVQKNGWAMSTPLSKDICVESVTQFGKGFGIPTVIIDGNDILTVKKEVENAAKWAREGNGPIMIEAETYRMARHSLHDEDDYRSQREKDEWTKKDPLLRFEKKLAEYGIEQKDLDGIKIKVKKEIMDAYEWAKDLPDITVEEMLQEQQDVVSCMWGGN